MRYIYPVCFYPEENGQYSIIFNDLSGIAIYGNTLDDAVDMATDLLCAWILKCKEDKKELPQHLKPNDINLEYDNGFINCITVDTDNYIAKRKKSIQSTSITHKLIKK